MVLLNFMCSPTARTWEGLGPISIKHEPLTILIYDTTTIFFNFIELTLFKVKAKMITD